MGHGIITASRTACLRAEHEVASRGEKCARLFSVGSEIAKNRFRDPPGTCCLPVMLPGPGPCVVAAAGLREIALQLLAAFPDYNGCKGGESIQRGRGKIDLLKFCMQRSGAAPASAVEMMGGARCTSCSGGC